MTITVKVEGLKEIYAALRDLPKATAKNTIRRVLKKRAQPIADQAGSAAPVEWGDLKKSIVVSTKLTKRQRAKYRKASSNDVDVFVGPSALPQAHLQEFGTSKEPAQPYMRPAWDKNKSGLLEGLADDMWKEIEKSVARMARKAARLKK